MPAMAAPGDTASPEQDEMISDVEIARRAALETLQAMKESGLLPPEEQVLFAPLAVMMMRFG